MRAPLSIIIPTLNAARELPLALESLMPGLEAGLINQVIVSDGGSTDATHAIAEAAGAEVISSAAGRGTQLRAGAQRSRGEWLMFLHADTALSRDWPERSTAFMASGAEKAAVFRLKFRSDATAARWVERGANLRTRWLGLPYGDQGLILTRDFYNALGGYPDQALMEDVALVRAIGKSRLVILDAEARTSAARYERDGWHQRSRRNGVLLARYLMGASPDALAKAYR